MVCWSTGSLLPSVLNILYVIHALRQFQYLCGYAMLLNAIWFIFCTTILSWLYSHSLVDDQWVSLTDHTGFPLPLPDYKARKPFIISQHNFRISVFGWMPTGCHDDVITRKCFPRYWPYVWGILRSWVNSLPKGTWRGAIMFSIDLHVNTRFSKQSRRRWFDKQSRSLWHYCN